MMRSGGARAMMNVSEGRTHAPRILVVEDDSEMRGLLADELLDEGYETYQAVDGEDAALKLAQDEFDLVIADVIMPKMSGLDLLSMVRKAYPNTPVILITAFGDDQTHAEAKRLGAAGMIDKPFEIPLLLSKARAILGS